MPKRKKRKVEKMRGSTTHGYGSRKKHKGAGSHGGRGMAGSGKRSDHRKTWILRYIGPSYYGKHGFASLKKAEKRKERVINIDELLDKMSKFLKTGAAKKQNDTFLVNLKAAGYNKLLSRGHVKEKLIIQGHASKEAAAKIQAAGGQIK